MTGFKEKKRFFCCRPGRELHMQGGIQAGGSYFSMETNAEHLACFINPQIGKKRGASE